MIKIFVLNQFMNSSQSQTVTDLKLMTLKYMYVINNMAHVRSQHCVVQVLYY